MLYVFCGISILIYTTIFIKGILSVKPIYAASAVVIMVCLIVLGIYLSKRGGIQVETSVWPPKTEEEK